MSVANYAKAAVQRTLRSFGWEIRRFSQGEMSWLASQLFTRGVSVVLDVGANEGQYGSALIAAGYRGRIISFEPLAKAHASLCRTATPHQAWSPYRRCALGSEVGELEINVSDNLVSSSFLRVMPEHVQAAPTSRVVRSERVERVRLDDIFEGFSGEQVFLKIDTQGYEMEVLRGAEKALGSIRGVQVELSLTGLYEGQPRYSEVLAYLEGIGFEVWELCPGFRNRETGRLLQCDVLMFRP